MKDHKGLLSKSKISTALRCLGFNLLNKEVCVMYYVLLYELHEGIWKGIIY